MNDTADKSPTVDYSQVAELPFHRATREQLSMMYTRYRFARDFVADRDVLEIACGGGIGLGYLARAARRVHGIDIDERNLAHARQRYASTANVELSLLDAHRLPFADAAYDVIILFDSIYFLTDAHQVLREAVRVLRPGGTLLVSTVNKRWDGFNPSDQGTRYFGGEEIVTLLQQLGCVPRAYGAFPTRDTSLRGAALSLLRQVAVKLHLIPTSVRSKEVLKRMFLGKLREFGAEVTDGMAELERVVEISAAEAAGDDYKILYFAAVKRAPEST